MQTGLTVYPNPASDVTYINVKDQGLKSIELLSISGALIYNLSANRESQAVSSAIYSVDLRSLPSGVYLLNITTTNGRSTEKIIKN